ncbi:Cyclin-U3-1 [Symbiodinium microadriaticum]|uniref:Cyclin-U3-1 n=1 Tax=Symbiodinium microadriaticum TaxID=2951 RepID=A0A1Q9DLQ2_SYMMI|nr:Cyclin-U3-1 [Symbiodinium microadriaticum]
MVSVEEVFTEHDFQGREMEVISEIADYLNQLASFPGPKGSVKVFDSAGPPPITVKDYLLRLWRYMDCSVECYVMALYYIDRLREHDFKVGTLNIHTVFLSCLVVAAKFHDDAFRSNSYYARVGGVSAKSLFHLETKTIELLEWKARVSAEEYRSFCELLLSDNRWVRLRQREAEKALVHADSGELATIHRARMQAGDCEKLPRTSSESITASTSTGDWESSDSAEETCSPNESFLDDAGTSGEPETTSGVQEDLPIASERRDKANLIGPTLLRQQEPCNVIRSEGWNTRSGHSPTKCEAQDAQGNLEGQRDFNPGVSKTKGWLRRCSLSSVWVKVHRGSGVGIAGMRPRFHPRRANSIPRCRIGGRLYSLQLAQAEGRGLVELAYLAVE